MSKIGMKCPGCNEDDWVGFDDCSGIQCNNCNNYILDSNIDWSDEAHPIILQEECEMSMVDLELEDVEDKTIYELNEMVRKEVMAVKEGDGRYDICYAKNIQLILNKMDEMKGSERWTN